MNYEKKQTRNEEMFYSGFWVRDYAAFSLTSDISMPIIIYLRDNGDLRMVIGHRERRLRYITG